MAGLFGVLHEGSARHSPKVGGASVGRRRKGNLLHVLGGGRLLDLGELIPYWYALLVGVLEAHGIPVLPPFRTHR